MFGGIILRNLETRMVEHVQIANSCTHIFKYAQNDATREHLLMRHIVNLT